MHLTQHSVAVPDSLHDHPDGDQVEDLIQLLVLVHHFLIYTVELLGAARDFVIHIQQIQGGPDVIHDFSDELFPFCFLRTDFLLQFRIGFRMKIFQRNVLQFILHGIDTETVRQRRIDLQSLPRFLHNLFRFHEFDGPHVVQTVRQLDNQDADVLGHGQEHFPKALRMSHFFRVELQSAQFRNTVHEKRHFFAKIFHQLFSGVSRVFHHIMKKTAHQCLIVHPQLGEDDCHGDRVNQVRLPALSELPRMQTLRQIICAADQFGVVILVLQDFVEKFRFRFHRHSSVTTDSYS